ncbi:uncharacterized protein LACBIDRAFT_304106 [Laccaria bicolor S238N-H82]|uniref:Predicted protein n=1 Tax=Laccaria bicolor (strain S238N-H82 / ATCC MYA-4686) TaxID=486041 RepID=B0DKY8_LACBS|nr:uncharacterized protein LACBIDRAFT_304106 [Laccaria bicolor S238N-H82]EDR04731.1 predicted protein [Laccaria bicolor S238N-H82]|eukprot:XP_001884555.1 predicted protein [Laccaria bicolor S238N-H82]
MLCEEAAKYGFESCCVNGSVFSNLHPRNASKPTSRLQDTAYEASQAMTDGALETTPPPIHPAHLPPSLPPPQ